MNHHKHVQDLCIDWLDGTISHEEDQQLENLLDNNPKALDAYLETLMLEATLRGLRNNLDLTEVTMEKISHIHSKSMEQNIMESIRKHPFVNPSHHGVTNRFGWFSKARFFLQHVLPKPISITGISTAVTLGLFFLMYSLIADRSVDTIQKSSPTKIEFTRTRRDTEVSKKTRKFPSKEVVKNPPVATNISTDHSSISTVKNGITIEAPLVLDVDDALNISGLQAMKGVRSSGGIVPLVRIRPIYPRAAQEKRIEGWVLVEFAISVTGAVQHPRVIDAYPPGHFEQATLRAIRKWKYKPMIKNGKPAETHGVMVKITFNLSEFED